MKAKMIFSLLFIKNVFHSLISWYKDVTTNGKIRGLRGHLGQAIWSAKFIQVVDGDTIQVMEDGVTADVKLEFIDTPLEQFYGEFVKGYSAKLFLEQVIYRYCVENDDFTLTMIGGNRDRDGRFICLVRLGTVDKKGPWLQELLYDNGFSAVDEEFNKVPPELREDFYLLESIAMGEGKGNWAKHIEYMRMVANRRGKK